MDVVHASTFSRFLFVSSILNPVLQLLTLTQVHPHPYQDVINTLLYIFNALFFVTGFSWCEAQVLLLIISIPMVLNIVFSTYIAQRWHIKSEKDQSQDWSLWNTKW